MSSVCDVVSERYRTWVISLFPAKLLQCLIAHGTVRFKLEGNLRVVMRTHAMHVISLAFSSESTHAQKILVCRFCGNTHVPIKALCMCLSEYSKTIQHDLTYTHNFPCRFHEKYPTTCNLALIQCTHIVSSGLLQS